MSKDNVTIRQLRAFLLLADCRSFTQAAAQLGVTQSGLSLLIKELESGLGGKLFDRHPRMVELTPAGLDFLAMAKRTVDSLDAAVGMMRDRRTLQRGQIRVGVPQMLAFAHMPHIASRFLSSYPNIDLSLIDGVVSRQFAPLRDGDLDLVIGPDAPGKDGVDAALLARSEVAVVCARNHRLASRKVVPWRELRDERFISATQDLLVSIQSLIREKTGGHEFGFRSVQTVEYMTTALGMASAGLGITMCPDFVAPFAKVTGLVMLRLEDPPFFRNVYIYTAAGRSATPAMDAFVDCAKLHFSAKT